MMSGRNFIFTLACLCALQTAGGAERDGTSARSDQNLSDLPVLRPDLRSGFANGAWKYDRYKQLESLDAHRRIVVADLKGPGIIRHLHLTRHVPPELMARGIVLEIRFDDAPELAVCCPLADFFGDGCNGKATNFSTPLIECAPWSYNCYFPMPFKQRAEVALRNDTDRDAMSYFYLEWENLPEWNPRLGYFHASFQRKLFQLTKDTDETLFEVRGSGHLIGRRRIALGCWLGLLNENSSNIFRLPPAIPQPSVVDARRSDIVVPNVSGQFRPHNAETHAGAERLRNLGRHRNR